MQAKSCSVLVAALMLPGCATWGPTWSEITGARYNFAIEYRRPAIIEHIDNQGAFITNPIKIDPGMRRVVIAAPVPGWTGGSKLEVFQLDAKPCMRYYINAQFKNNVEPDFQPVIDYAETIAGCQMTAAK